MRLEPILRAHAYMNVERPPELWEAASDEERFVPLLGEMIAAALAGGARLRELTLNASNIVVEPADDDDPPMVPHPGEYVAITVGGPADLGPDDTWRPAASCAGGHFSRLGDRLDAARAEFAYVRRIPPGGSLTVLFARLEGQP